MRSNVKETLFKIWPSLGEVSLAFELERTTVFVGPNYSGKSLILREIESYTENGKRSSYNILQDVEFEFPIEEESKQLVLKRKTSVNYSQPEGFITVSKIDLGGQGFRQQQINLEQIIQSIKSNQSTDSLCLAFASLFTIRLDGRTRFALTEPRPVGDLQQQPTNHLVALFKDDKAREHIRNITADAFGLYFVIDPTNLSNLRIRMSNRLPQEASEEQALDQRARYFHEQAKDITELSDGIKAFTGIIAAVMSTDYRIMLVDEPEAFLHPPLAKKLGRRLTELASKRQANILASTHSSDFLMGCIQAGERINVIRLTYKQGIPTARLLSANKLQEMMRDPLLRSTGVLSTLFYEGVIIGEADRDRAFYQEINERLLTAGQGGVDNCIFLNAQNWQTIHRILRPLREIGIPAAAIVDLDTLKGNSTDFGNLLRSAFVPQELIQSLGVLRGNVICKFEEENLNLKKGGINLLSGESKEAAQNLLHNLNEYGIFPVPHGEIESWLAELQVAEDKSKWLIKVFEMMGTDPADPSYLHPQDGDVWNFMKKVAAWVENPQRKGIPK
jgi:ABC-type phosphate/phosphonate transport system ATPase subunit